MQYCEGEKGTRVGGRCEAGISGDRLLDVLAKVPSTSKQFQPCMLQVRLFCGRPSQESMFSCHRLRVTSYISICIAASLLLAHPTTAYKLQAPKGVGRDGRVQLGLSEAI